MHKPLPRAELAFWALAASVLLAAAWLRGPEYDEAYSIFLTAGHARPDWPTGVFTAGAVRGLYQGHAGFWRIALDLRRGDVHPPLYFWALAVWRDALGPGWFTARLLSVALSLAGLFGLRAVARGLGQDPLPVLAMTLLAYGFAYTGSVARGFALAQGLNIAGVFCALRGRGGRAGLAFGAASFSNYLAVFTAGPMLLWLLARDGRQGLRAGLGMAPFLAADGWFFLAQRGSRVGQFEPFSLGPALARLGRDAGAAWFGGLPLYAGRFAPVVGAALGLLALLCLGLAARRRAAWLPLALAAATPCGLLALGLLFHNTPIEIRYAAFAMPWVALAVAPALPRPLLGLVLAVQALGIAGLLFAASTMQPQGRAARLAAAYPGAVVALPFGNDGVGVPGPFIEAAPETMRILLLHPGQSVPPGAVRAALGVDAASRAVAAAMGCAKLVCGPGF